MLLYFKKSFIILSYIISYFLWIPLKVISGILILKAKKKKRNYPEKILVQNGYLLGDTLNYSNALLILKKGFSDSKIYLITHPSACEFLKNSNWVDGYIEFCAPWAFRQPFLESIKTILNGIKKVRSYNFNIAIDLSGDIRGLAFLLACGIPNRISFSDFGGAPFCTKSFSTPKNSEYIRARWTYFAETLTGNFSEYGCPAIWPNIPKHDTYLENIEINKHLVLIHPGTYNLEKKWPEEYFAELISMLNKQFFFEVEIWLIGGKRDENIINKIKSMVDFDLRCEYPSFYELEILIKKASVLVCLDSFVQHVASIFGTPTIAIYGPSNPRYFAPQDNKISVAWNNLILYPPYLEYSGPQPANATKSEIIYRAVLKEISKIKGKEIRRQ